MPSHALTALFAAAIVLPTAALAAGPKPLPTTTKTAKSLPKVTLQTKSVTAKLDGKLLLSPSLSKVQLLDKIKKGGFVLPANPGMDQVTVLSSTKMRNGTAFMNVSCATWQTGWVEDAPIWWQSHACDDAFVDVMFEAVAGRVYSVECQMSGLDVRATRLDDRGLVTGGTDDLGPVKNPTFVIGAASSGLTGVKFQFDIPDNGGMIVGKCQVARVAN